MTAPFDLQEFYTVCLEIDIRLGYLRANECVHEWWQRSQKIWQSQEGMKFRSEANIYQSSTQDVSYDCQFDYSYVPVGNSDGQDAQIMQQIYLEADAAWNDGLGWASGISSYLEDMCAPFTKPDRGALQSLISDYEAAAAKLGAAVPANWTTLDVEQWIGAAHDQYAAFQNHLFDSMVQYDTALEHCRNWVTAVGALISQTQTGLMPLLKGVNDELDTQLKQWALTYGNPASTGGHVNAVIANLITLGDNLLSYVPEYSQVKGAIENVKTTTQDALAVFNASLPKFQQDADFTLHSATEIYEHLSTTLQDEFATPFAGALLKLSANSRTTVSYINDKGNKWFPPRIPNARTMTWEPTYGES